MSYRALVGRPSQGAVGETLVVPGDPDNSYLIKKLKGTAAVGDQMPQGGEPLSKGTIKLIEQWIARGALTTAVECPPANSSTKRPRGRKSCNDRPVRTGAFVWTPEPALPPPSSEGADGIQFYTPPLDVAAGKEWEKCYAFKGVDWLRIAAELGYPPGALPVLKQQTYRMHNGSHHLLVYGYFGEVPGALGRRLLRLLRRPVRLLQPERLPSRRRAARPSRSAARRWQGPATRSSTPKASASRC